MARILDNVTHATIDRALLKVRHDWERYKNADSEVEVKAELAELSKSLRRVLRLLPHLVDRVD